MWAWMTTSRPARSRPPSLEPMGRAGWLACVGAALLVGCSADLDTGAGAQPDAGCQVTGCPANQVCAANNQCTPAQDTVRVALRIVPPEDSGLLPEQILDLRIDRTDDLRERTLTSPTRVEGRVVRAGTPLTPLPSRIIFTRDESGIPQYPIQREATTDEDGQYAISLVPGTYRVTVRPNGEALPPFRPAIPFTVSGEEQGYEINLPSTEEYYRLTGSLVRSLPDSAATLPVDGARVSLISSTTRATVSTTAVSDTNGEFTLTATPNEPGYLLSVAPADVNGDVPELVWPEVFDISGNADLGELILGEWADPLVLSGHVRGRNGIEEPVADATLFFQQDLEVGRYTQLVQAEAEGEFAATLIPGSYTVTIVPPADAVYGADALVEELQADSSPPELAPILSHKPILFGRVVGPQGVGISGVTVRAEPTGYGVRLLDLGPVSVLSDSTGAYELPIHPGRQRITVQPPPGSTLAPLVTDLGAVSGDLELPVALGNAHTLSGTILAPDRTPLEGATIEAFVWIIDDEIPISFALTETGADGRFAVNLPIIGLD